MNIILNIDTAVDVASVSIAKDGEIMARASNSQQKDHGGFLQPAIASLLKDTGISIQELDAIAISAGPGSYTGLRVGMATAKGLCYALKKPLITINTLEILASAAISQFNEKSLKDSPLFCPMIDARRNEVFTAMYHQNLREVLKPVALVLDQNSFAKSLLNSRVFFFGNGSEKWKLFCSSSNANFIELADNHMAMSKLADRLYRLDEFADLAYSTPFYLKEFYTGPALK
ncbi:MAG: tsaB [Ferruginibacter sp.]|nr:tsaB [Ferruginibacter sp.]